MSHGGTTQPSGSGQVGQLEESDLTGRPIGNYQAVRLLGSGGTGQVYLAEHPQIDRQVAVKVLADHLSRRPDAAARFLNEAKAVSRIQHPNVIEVFDFGRLKDGRPYLVMELLDGSTLQGAMDARKKRSAEELRPFVEQLCAGLQAAHDGGVVHRDLKPENVFLLSEQPVRLKILDFSIAKLLERPPGVTQTDSGVVMGTPLVVAPEQAAGLPHSITPRTDLYSLGVILYWMLSGEPPFYDEAPGLLLSKHINDDPVPLKVLEPAVPAAVARLVHDCLEKAPADRPTSAASVARRYGEALEKPDAAAAAAIPVAAPGDGPKRRLWPLLALALLLGLGMTWYLTRASQTSPLTAGDVPAQDALGALDARDARDAATTTATAPATEDAGLPAADREPAAADVEPASASPSPADTRGAAVRRPLHGSSPVTSDARRLGPVPTAPAPPGADSGVRKRRPRHIGEGTIDPF